MPLKHNKRIHSQTQYVLTVFVTLILSWNKNWNHTIIQRFFVTLILSWNMNWNHIDYTKIDSKWIKVLLLIFYRNNIWYAVKGCNLHPHIYYKNRSKSNQARKAKLMLATHFIKIHKPIKKRFTNCLPLDMNWSLGKRSINWKTFSLAPTDCINDDKLSPTHHVE